MGRKLRWIAIALHAFVVRVNADSPTEFNEQVVFKIGSSLRFCANLRFLIRISIKMSKAAGKAVRNVKKVVEKINHSRKLRTDIQAQMAVGELSLEFLRSAG